jgi:hypothetical protein
MIQVDCRELHPRRRERIARDDVPRSFGAEGRWRITRHEGRHLLGRRGLREHLPRMVAEICHRFFVSMVVAKDEFGFDNDGLRGKLHGPTNVEKQAQ